jgi:hypothetical protein
VHFFTSCWLTVEHPASISQGQSVFLPKSLDLQLGRFTLREPLTTFWLASHGGIRAALRPWLLSSFCMTCIARASCNRRSGSLLVVDSLS